MHRDAINSLAVEGLIYDSGTRRDGQIVWKATPGTKSLEEAKAMFAKSEGEK